MATDKLFGFQLKKERIKRGFTVQILATACGISRSYLTLIENGRRLPGKKILSKIAAALKLNTATVLDWYLKDISHKMRSL